MVYEKKVIVQCSTPPDISIIYKSDHYSNLLIRGKPYHLRKFGEYITDVLGITRYLPLKIERLKLKLGYNDENVM